MPPIASKTAWPAQPDPKWPTNCEVEDLGIHPHEPWLTLACSDSSGGHTGGALLVIDVRSGDLLSVSKVSGFVGWRGDGGLVLWDPAGERLCSNVETNAIGLFERGKLVATSLPDDTRGSPVDYAWVDHRVYTELGDFYDPAEHDGYIETADPPFEPIWWTIERLKWVPGLDAVVGVANVEEDANSASELVAFAPQRNKTIYRVPMGTYAGDLAWSRNRRFVAAKRSSRESETLDVFDTHRGRLARSVPNVRGDALVRDDGLVVMSASRFLRSVVDIKLEVLAVDGSRSTLPKRAPWRDSTSLAPRSALSPDGFGLAQLLDDASIVLFDVTSGRELASFPAPIPPSPENPSETHPSAGLVWVSLDRVAVVGAHFTKIWSLDGTLIAEFLVPTG